MEEKDKMHLGASPLIFLRAKELRRNMTVAEKILWEELRNRKLKGLKFRNQHPILKYVLDFYCHSRQIGIELDGEFHNTKDQEYYDEDRTNNLRDYGIKIIRFSNQEVYNNVKGVKKKIIKECG